MECKSFSSVIVGLFKAIQLQVSPVINSLYKTWPSDWAGNRYSSVLTLQSEDLHEQKNIVDDLSYQLCYSSSSASRIMECKSFSSVIVGSFKAIQLQVSPVINSLVLCFINGSTRPGHPIGLDTVTLQYQHLSLKINTSRRTSPKNGTAGSGDTRNKVVHFHYGAINSAGSRRNSNFTASSRITRIFKFPSCNDGINMSQWRAICHRHELVYGTAVAPGSLWLVLLPPPHNAMANYKRTVQNIDSDERPRTVVEQKD
ncbi:hypothetical protein J6590_042123 [Homalodisca vitripennis]|nr:hypothetical protein J6590_042123 [Homalodisca vitripennis]